MDIQRPGGLSGPKRVDARSVSIQSGAAAGGVAAAGDRVQISEHARWLEMLSHVPAVRSEKVEELRRQIEAGEFETPERIEGAVRQLMEELGYTP